MDGPSASFPEEAAFSEEDKLFPVYCAHCKRQLPRAVLASPTGWCIRCLRAETAETGKRRREAEERERARREMLPSPQEVAPPVVLLPRVGLEGWLAAGLVLVVLLVVIWAVVGARQEQEGQAAAYASAAAEARARGLEQLRTGMTSEEVSRLLGDPDHAQELTTGQGPAEQSWYYGAYQLIFLVQIVPVTLENFRPVPPDLSNGYSGVAPPTSQLVLVAVNKPVS